jgi:hypothetical protein
MRTYNIQPNEDALSTVAFNVQADRMWLGLEGDWVMFYKNLGRFKGEQRIFAIRSKYVESVKITD